MIKQFKKEVVTYKNKSVDAIVLKRYSSGFEKSKGYLIAEVVEKTDKGNIRYTISEVTRKTDGVVYIPWEKLVKAVKSKNFLRMKIYTGKGESYRYWIHKKFEVMDFIITCEMKHYNKNGEVKEQLELLKTAQKGDLL